MKNPFFASKPDLYWGPKKPTVTHDKLTGLVEIENNQLNSKLLGNQVSLAKAKSRNLPNESLDKDESTAARITTISMTSHMSHGEVRTQVMRPVEFVNSSKNVKDYSKPNPVRKMREINSCTKFIRESGLVGLLNENKLNQDMYVSKYDAKKTYMFGHTI